LIATQSNSAQSIQYRSNRWRTLFVITLFSVNIVVGLIAIASDASQVAMGTRVANGEHISSTESEASDTFRQNIAVVQFGLYLFTSVVFLFWIYHAHKNLQAFGAESLSSSSGFAVVGFFIPIFNWFVPAINVSEIWKASDLKASAGTSWQHVKTSPLVIIWWLVFLGWHFTNVLESIVNDWPGLLEEVTLSYYMRIGHTRVIGDIFCVVSAMLSIALAYLINRRQELKVQAM
jgi:hypothetical protein